METAFDQPPVQVLMHRSEIQAAIDQIEREFALSEERIEVPVKHGFPTGIYVREVTVPAGCRLVSRVHKTEYAYVVSKGSILVFTEGEGLIQIDAPFTGFSQPGSRRICQANTDTVWTTFHPNPKNITDIEKLEAELFEPLGEHLQ